MSDNLYKSSPCRGSCDKNEADCRFAHSIHSWNPKHPSLTCRNGMDCWQKETTCCRIHDGSLADKIRLARYLNIQFVIPYEPKKRIIESPPVLVWSAPKENVWSAPKENIPEVDPLHELQLEKAMLQSELEALNILKKKLEVRMLEFKKKASDYWEAGSTELEF